MKLRQYQSTDCIEMSQLFYDTVHTVNRRDYTEEQVHAWADGHVDLEAWNQSFMEHFTVVAEDGGRIVGFGDMTKDGYLDRLYVHRNYQGMGFGKALCSCMEQWFVEARKSGSGQVTTHASITARPFFEGRGYTVVREQQVERRGQRLTNYVMEKEISVTVDTQKDL